MKCPICNRDMVADIYTCKKEDGTTFVLYYCEECCKVYEVRNE